MDARIRGLRRPAALIGLYFLGAVVASLFLRTTNDVTLFWPSAGIAYGATIRYGLRWAVLLPLTLLVFHPLFAPVPPAFVVYSIGSNVAATLVAGWFVRRNSPLQLGTRDALMILRGGLILAAISATIGSLGLVETGLLPRDSYAASWALWLLGDLLGITTVTPGLLLLTAPRTSTAQASPLSETSALRERAVWSLCLVASFAIIYMAGLQGITNRFGLVALPLILLLWSAMRFSPAWNAVATTLVVTYLSLITGLGLGGFTQPTTLLDTMVLLVLLNLVAIIPVLLSLSGLEQRTTAQALYQRATRDTLTGLCNRGMFEEQARQCLADARQPVSLLYLDLDNFKIVNDSASHIAGDALLKALSGVLSATIPGDRLLARTGGDEFAILLRSTGDEAVEQSRQLLGEVEGLRLPWGDQVLAVTASIGIATSDARNRDYDSLYSHADAACFAAKEMGGNRLHVSDPDSDETRTRSAAMRSAMRVRGALEHGQLELFCQPIVPLREGLDDGGAHFEVLLRWRQPDGSLHAPAELIAAAERFGLGPRLDRHVLDAALGWLEAHPDAARRTRSCSLNISAATLVDEEFADFLAARLHRSSVPAERICLEITETSVIRDRGRAQRFIHRMHDMGCRFALDDFGTGFCSFSYLRDLQVDFLKIDGSFVRGGRDPELSQAVVHSIAEIAHVLRTLTIAEQVETDGQRARMQQMGVDYAQGYFFSQPQPIEAYFAGGSLDGGLAASRPPDGARVDTLA